MLPVGIRNHEKVVAARKKSPVWQEIQARARECDKSWQGFKVLERVRSAREGTRRSGRGAPERLSVVLCSRSIARRASARSLGGVRTRISSACRIRGPRARSGAGKRQWGARTLTNSTWTGTSSSAFSAIACQAPATPRGHNGPHQMNTPTCHPKKQRAAMEGWERHIGGRPSARSRRWTRRRVAQESRDPALDPRRARAKERARGRGLTGERRGARDAPAIISRQSWVCVWKPNRNLESLKIMSVSDFWGVRAFLF